MVMVRESCSSLDILVEVISLVHLIVHRIVHFSSQLITALTVCLSYYETDYQILSRILTFVTHMSIAVLKA